MNSIVDICNYALSQLSVEKDIQSLSEQSSNARACKRWYKLALQTTLRDFPWPFATSEAEPLTLLETFNINQGVSEGFGYVFSYQYPPNAARLLRVYDKYWTGRIYGYFGSGSQYDRVDRFSDGNKGYPYKIVDGDNGRVIFTDAQEARAVYTKMDIPESRFDDDFVLALSLKLAYLMAPRLARGEERTIMRVKEDYMLAISTARSNGLNEEQPEPLPDSDLVRSRM